MACKKPTKTRIDCIQLDPLLGSLAREPMGSGSRLLFQWTYGISITEAENQWVSLGFCLTPHKWSEKIEAPITGENWGPLCRN